MTPGDPPARLLPGTEPALDAARLRMLSDAAACLVGRDVAQALAALAAPRAAAPPTRSTAPQRDDRPSNVY